MTPTDLAVARNRLGLTQAGLALALRMGKHGGRTVRRWELGEVEVPGPVEVAVELMLERQAMAEEVGVSKQFEVVPAYSLGRDGAVVSSTDELAIAILTALEASPIGEAVVRIVSPAAAAPAGRE